MESIEIIRVHSAIPQAYEEMSMAGTEVKCGDCVACYESSYARGSVGMRLQIVATLGKTSSARKRAAGIGLRGWIWPGKVVDG